MKVKHAHKKGKWQNLSFKKGQRKWLMQKFAPFLEEDNTPPPSPPPDTNWEKKKIASHDPGFFSCAKCGSVVLLGTYQSRRTSDPYLCRLLYEGPIGEYDEGRYTFYPKVATFSGESVYHIRPYGDTVYLPIEQGHLFKTTPMGDPTLLYTSNFVPGMGTYDALQLGSDVYWIEKEGIHDGRFNIRKNNAVFASTHSFVAKDMCYINDYFYFAATLRTPDDRNYCGMWCYGPVSGAGSFTKLIWKTEGYTGNLTLFNNRVYVTLQDGGARIYSYDVNSGEIRKYRVAGRNSWFVGKIGDDLFATSTEGTWRSNSGPSYLWKYDAGWDQWRFLLKFSEAEPWCMCEGFVDKTYIFATRTANSKGAVYLLRDKTPDDYA